MNAAAIINDYIDTLAEQAKMAGDIRNTYAITFMHDTLMHLNLPPQVLKKLQQETAIFRDIIAKK